MKWEEMTPRQRDALVAEKVLGFEVQRGRNTDEVFDGAESTWEVWVDSTGKKHNPIPLSTDIAAAWTVAEKMYRNGYSISVSLVHGWRAKTNASLISTAILMPMPIFLM